MRRADEVPTEKISVIAKLCYALVKRGVITYEEYADMKLDDAVKKLDELKIEW